MRSAYNFDCRHGCSWLVVVLVVAAAVVCGLALKGLEEETCQTQPKFKNRCDPATMLSPTAARQSSQTDATSLLDCKWLVSLVKQQIQWGPRFPLISTGKMQKGTYQKEEVNIKNNKKKNTPWTTIGSPTRVLRSTCPSCRYRSPRPSPASPPPRSCGPIPPGGPHVAWSFLVGTPAKNIVFCLVSGKQRDPQKARKNKKGS